MQEIQGRGLDQFYNTEEDLLVGKGDLAHIEKLLQVSCPYPDETAVAEHVIMIHQMRIVELRWFLFTHWST